MFAAEGQDLLPDLVSLRRDIHREPEVGLHLPRTQQKILDANEAGVPFYVHIDEELNWHGWRDADMCQLLGVLLDNACEAAMLSDAPYISLEFHNLRQGMEVVVRNTWGEKKEEVQPTIDTAPSRGLGLLSVQALLKRYPRTTFSLYHRDRYVEAHLIM